MRYVTFRKVYGQRDPEKERVEFQTLPEPDFVMGWDQCEPFVQVLERRHLGVRGTFYMPNRSSVDNSLNNHRTLDGMDHPHARLIAKIRTALCNLPSSRQDEYLKSLRLI